MNEMKKTIMEFYFWKKYTQLPVIKENVKTNSTDFGKNKVYVNGQITYKHGQNTNSIYNNRWVWIRSS